MNTKILLCIGFCLLLFKPFLGAQEQVLTRISDKAKHYLDATAKDRASYVHASAAHFEGTSQAKSLNNTTIYVPIQVHILQNNSGGQAMPYFSLTFLLNEINAELAPANIQLYNCGALNFITDNDLYDLDLQNEEVLLDNIDAPNAMNIYFVNTLRQSPNGISYCGLSSYPGDGNRIIYSRTCFGYSQTSVMMHLIGQYFSLYRTHGQMNGQTDELVNGSNCATAGDEICDTPADPDLSRSGAMASGCTYVGTFKDADNRLYMPDVTNYMSYASGTCRNSFTPMQMARMYYSVQNDRPNLACSKPAPCAFKISQYPYNFSFENGLNGWDNEPFYVSTVVGKFLLNSGPTPTAGTGPTTAADGNNYLYAEATLVQGPNPYVYPVATLESPCFDFSSMSTPQMSFSYHMNGSDIGTLSVQYSTDGGYVWNGLPNSWSGDQGNNWLNATVDLSAVAGAPSVKLRFGVTFISATADVGDIAIDGIRVEDLNPCVFDAEVNVQDVSCFGLTDGAATLTYPSPGTAPYTITWSTGATNVNTINNLSAGGYNVSVTDDAGCTDIVEFIVDAPGAALIANVTSLGASSETTADGGASVLVNGGTSPYSYQWSNGTTVQNLTAVVPGVYEVTVTDAASCSTIEEIYVGVATTCNKTHKNFPYFQNFEGGLGLFTQESTDDINWRKRTNATPTSNTGPSAAIEGNYYRYLESSGNSNPGKVGVISTKKCLKLSPLNNPTLAFQYHMYGNTMGSLEVQISTDGGASWIGIWKKEGDQGNSWKLATIDLTPYQTDQTRIRFVGKTGNGFRSDIAIDDLYIGGTGTNSNFVSRNEILDKPIAVVNKTLISGIYPNPARDEVWVNLQAQENVNYSIEIINLLGQPVKSIALVVNSKSVQVDISALERGLYYLVAIDDKGNRQIESLIVE